MNEIDSKIIQAVAKKNNLDVQNPKRFSSGVINRVYDLGSTVLKIEGGDLTDYAKGILAPQPKIAEKLLSLGAKIPKIIDYGKIEDRPYILMEKVKGECLVYKWLELSLSEKENYIAQMTEQLRIFHSIKFDEYSVPIYVKRNYKNLAEVFEDLNNFKLVDKSKLKSEYTKPIDFLEQYYQEHKKILDEQGTAVLIHGDMHLENIFYKDNKLASIIDLDWIAQAPIDYELRKITEVFYDPQRTVEAKFEPIYEGHRMTQEFGFIKKHYPELFLNPNLLMRLRLFNIEDMIYKIADYQKGRWSEKVMQGLLVQIDDFFKPNGWLEKVLK